MSEISIVVVEDDPVQLAWYQTYFEVHSDPPCRVNYVRNMRDYARYIQTHRAHCAIVDYFLPDGTGADVLSMTRAVNPGCEVIFISALKEIRRISDLIKLGAREFIEKPVNSTRLSAALHQVGIRLANPTLPGTGSITTAATDENTAFTRIIHRSETMSRLVIRAGTLALQDNHLLIRGETGSGKRLLAKVIHDASSNRSKAFITINCSTAGIGSMDELLELIAQKQTSSDTGLHATTVCIEHPEKMNSSLQAEFSEHLRSGSSSAEGGSYRFICISSADIEQLVRENRFNKELYQRLSLTSITIPPLRDRKEDIPPLARYFLGQAAGDQKDERNLEISPEAESALVKYSYPRNTGELKAIIETAAATASGSIDTSHLPSYLNMTQVVQAPEESQLSPKTQAKPITQKTGAERQEMRLILRALESSRGDISAAAELLGTNRRKLQQRIRELSIQYNKR